MNQNSPLSLAETQTLRTTKVTINTYWKTFKADIVSKLNANDFPDGLPDDFTQLSQDQKTLARKAITTQEAKTHLTELQEMGKALQDRLVIYHKHNGKVEAPNEKDTTSGSVKLAKYMSNEIRTQTTKTFLTTVADAMTTFIGNINTGVQAKIDTASINLDQKGNYSCQFTYGDSATSYSLKINANGKVEMTNLLAS